MSVHWMWWIAAMLLIGAELLTGTFYLLAVGIAVALGGVAAWLGAGVAVQFGIAGVLGVVLTIVAHRWRLGRATPPPQAGLDIGQSVKVPAGATTAERASRRLDVGRGARKRTFRAESSHAGTRGSVLVLSDRRPTT
jgi:hypothetical protein